MKFASGNKYGRTQTGKQIVGLRASDIPSYDEMDQSHKNKAKERATRVIKNMLIDHVETSILPPALIRKLWDKHKGKNQSYKLVIREAFDKGSVFLLEK